MATLLVILVVLLSTVGPVPAAEEKRVSPQAQRMKDCNSQARARSLTGDVRTRFMSDCLKGGGAAQAERVGQGAAASSEAEGQRASGSAGKR